MKANKDKLLLVMARLCVSAEDIKRITGMPRSTVNKVLAGKSVRAITIGKVARALQIDVIDILDKIWLRNLDKDYTPLIFEQAPKMGMCCLFIY